MSARKEKILPSIPNPEDILTASDVADFFRVSTGTVNRWELTGKLTPAFRTLGGHRRYLRSDILALINSLKDEPGE